jgi:hypothetical protein
MLVHAAALSAAGTTESTHAVVLQAPNEQALLELEQRLIFEQIPHAAFREPDAPYNGQLMSIGIAPCDRRIVRRYLRSFFLVGDPNDHVEERS